ncbi:hypothetical protein BV22DRAFT_1114386 [Leucogyrophana mollusca]|uniref:Uncharacterized protein n=1 Tax=Leucogyrophana mollusca TaxID=85980 RepID=A0ACB8B991_9AGAM|nr:hypothetical protein BV22DRAFT_1114386 [Leucogyrophana mollusca]
MPVLVVYNPVCGNSTAGAFFDEHVFPLLRSSSTAIDEVVCTENVGHAGTAVISFLETHDGDVTIILGSGDGTLHEIINALSLVTLKGVRENKPASPIRLALVPCGTANALYSSFFPPDTDIENPSYRLRSVKAFLAGSGAVPLTLAFTTLSSPPAPTVKRPQVTVSAVVTSTALHASILHDSESLRKEIPGIDRFKVAARNNITQWYNSYVKLLPIPSVGVVQIYDPDTNSFLPHEDSDEDNPIVDMYGPFAYFLSTVNVDRLEPAFCISPVACSIPSKHPSLDIVIVRPERDPTFDMDTREKRISFAEKAGMVLSAAYQAGSHIKLRYGEDGTIHDRGRGPNVVEYIRCGGWEWIPDDVDDKAHLLCSDGAIFNIEKGGRAVCVAARPAENTGFMIYIS